MINNNFMLAKENGTVYLKITDKKLKYYYLKYKGMVNVKIKSPEEPGTEKQNRTMHSLLQAYYLTNMHSAPEVFGKSLNNFKVWMKRQYGPCYTIDANGEKIIIPKSWKDYTKEERCELISGIITEIHNSGAYAASEKIREIINGMENL